MKNNNYKNIPLLIVAIGLLIIVGMIGCKKLVEVDTPSNNLSAVNVYQDDATAIAAMTGVYTKISNSMFDLKSFSITSVSLYTSILGDELTLHNLNDVFLANYYRNNLSSISGDFFWNAAYDHIFTVNSAIEGLTKAKSLSPDVKLHLLGEAKFVRAFCYFYLTNLYGDIPLVLTTNWHNNASASSAPQMQVYSQILQDLKEAKDLLAEDYLASDLLSRTNERIRPNKWAASALLARTYLYTKDWANSEREATDIINNRSLYDTVTLNSNGFKKNNVETIWGLQPARSGLQSNTGEGYVYILPATGPNTSTYPVYLSNSLVESFEPGDQRKQNWIDSIKPSSTAFYYAKKYKIGRTNTSTQEYNMVFRLAEMYLVRAEARAQQNNLTSAIADLDVIRKRSGLPLIANTNPGISQSALLTAILHERRLELFTEWGHRWLDLKRTGNIDLIMTSAAQQKGAVWSPYKALLPIPYSEINLNPNISQNSGY